MHCIGCIVSVAPVAGLALTSTAVDGLTGLGSGWRCCAALPTDINIARVIAIADRPVFMNYFFILVDHPTPDIEAVKRI